MSLASQEVRTNPSVLIPDISALLYVSTISTTHITLDGNGLDTVGSGGTASLLLNGTAIATTSQLSTSIANWSLYQAISTVTYATGGGTGGNVVMSNGIFSNVSTSIGSVNQFNVSTINGSTLPELGQTVLYRTGQTLSNLTFNNNTTALQVLQFPNPIPGKVAYGQFNADFAGNIGGSNSAQVTPQITAWITDNSNSPYAPSGNSLGGFQYDVFFPIGPTAVTGAINQNFSTNVNCSFAFSNSPSNLFLIWTESTNGPSANLVFRGTTANFNCIVSGATASNV